MLLFVYLFLPSSPRSPAGEGRENYSRRQSYLSTSAADNFITQPGLRGVKSLLRFSQTLLRLRPLSGPSFISEGHGGVEIYVFSGTSLSRLMRLAGD